MHRVRKSTLAVATTAAAGHLRNRKWSHIVGGDLLCIMCSVGTKRGERACSSQCRTSWLYASTIAGPLRREAPRDSPAQTPPWISGLYIQEHPEQPVNISNPVPLLVHCYSILLCIIYSMLCTMYMCACALCCSALLYCTVLSSSSRNAHFIFSRCCLTDLERPSVHRGTRHVRALTPIDTVP